MHEAQCLKCSSYPILHKQGSSSVSQSSSGSQHQNHFDQHIPETAKRSPTFTQKDAKNCAVKDVVSFKLFQVDVNRLPLLASRLAARQLINPWEAALPKRRKRQPETGGAKHQISHSL